MIEVKFTYRICVFHSSANVLPCMQSPAGIATSFADSVSLSPFHQLHDHHVSAADLINPHSLTLDSSMQSFQSMVSPIYNIDSQYCNHTHDTRTFSSDSAILSMSMNPDCDFGHQPGNELAASLSLHASSVFSVTPHAPSRTCRGPSPSNDPASAQSPSNIKVTCPEYLHNEDTIENFEDGIKSTQSLFHIDTQAVVNTSTNCQSGTKPNDFGHRHFDNVSDGSKTAQRTLY